MVDNIIIISILIFLFIIGFVFQVVYYGDVEEEKENKNCPVRKMFPNNYIENLLETVEVELESNTGFIELPLGKNIRVITRFKIDNIECSFGYFSGYKVENIPVECKFLDKKISTHLRKAIDKRNNEYLIRLGKSKMKS
jgi:hypothetical protein